MLGSKKSLGSILEESFEFDDALPEELLIWMLESKVTSDVTSEANGAQEIHRSQFLALMDPSDQSLGHQLPRNRLPRTPWFLVAEATLREVMPLTRGLRKHK